MSGGKHSQTSEKDGQKVAVRYSFPITFGLVGGKRDRKSNY